MVRKFFDVYCMLYTILSVSLSVYLPVANVVCNAAPQREATPSNLTSSSSQQVCVQDSATPHHQKQTAALRSPTTSVVNARYAWS